jgi:hypothetical protein
MSESSSVQDSGLDENKFNMSAWNPKVPYDVLQGPNIQTYREPYL